MIRMFRSIVPPKALELLGECITDEYLGEGPKVREFEERIRARLCNRLTYCVNSGTSALWLAYHLAKGNKRNPRAVVTPLTCLATTMPLLLQGYEITWVDVDPNTGNMDPKKLRELLDDIGHVDVIVTCDWGGTFCDYEQIWPMAQANGAVLIEDAAHAFGGRYKSMPAGHSADYTCFSFQAIKPVTCGDGGAIVCRTEAEGERIRLLRWFGLDRTKGESMRCYQQVPEAGFKFQMNDLAASMGLASLGACDYTMQERRKIAQFYDEAFTNHPGLRPLDRGPGSNCWLYSLRVKDAKHFIAKMAEVGVECSQVHARNDTQHIFREANGIWELHGMDELEKTLVCIPCGHWLTGDEVNNIIWRAKDAA